ncbi:hypothetical protein NGC52_21230, partial [Klebsiella michiganensis]|nr:hypothetical protein [Klebsiella michiganensis]
MAYLPEQPEWTDGVYQLEKSDPVRGGVDGPANRPLIDLLKRTAWLKQRYEEAFSGLGWAELGEWAVGLEVTTPSQIVHYQGYWYRYGGSLPHTITGASPSLDDNDNWFNLGNDVSLRANLGSDEGLKLVGQCASLTELRGIEPSATGQQIYLAARVSGWAATPSGMPWGGGKFRYISNLPSSLQIDDGGSIIKTSGGKCWVREELLSGLGEIRVEWYLDGAPSFTDDASDAFQTAADTGKLWAQYSRRNKTVRLVMPAMMYITKTITVNTRGVRIDGNHGYC